MEDNPYSPPQTPLNVTPGPKGRPCPACGSRNTTMDELKASRPGILTVLFFGWIFLLIRSAFRIRTDHCLDCGATDRYKTVGSWIALMILIVITLSIIAAWLGSE